MSDKQTKYRDLFKLVSAMTDAEFQQSPVGLLESCANRIPDPTLALWLKSTWRRKDALDWINQAMREAGVEPPVQIPMGEAPPKPASTAQSSQPAPAPPVVHASTDWILVRFPTANQMVQYLNLLWDVVLQSSPHRNELWIYKDPGFSASDSAGKELHWGLVLPLSMAQLKPFRLDELAAAFGGIFGDPGKVRRSQGMTAREFLERVQLCPRNSFPSQRDRLIVVLLGKTTSEAGEVYRSFPAGQYERCRFIFGRAADRNAIFLFFEGIKRFEFVVKWVSSHLRDVGTAYYPISAAADERFFCQWGQVHPLEKCLPLLHDLPLTGQDSGREALDAYVLFSRSKTETQWVRIARKDMQGGPATADHLYKIEMAAGYNFYSVTVPQIETWPKTDLELRVTRGTGGGVANVVRLRRRAEALRNAAADVERKFEQTQQLVQGQCCVALVFTQEKEEGGGSLSRLPVKLERFLRRPYQSLDSYRYAYIDGRTEVRHVLINEVPAPLLESLGAGADEIYVQDVRWRTRSPAVFIRYGTELSPGLDDPVIANQFRENFIKSNDSAAGDEIAYCLVDPLSRSEDSTKSIVLTTIPRTTKLIESIPLHNRASHHGVERAISAFPIMAQGALEIRRAELTGELQGYYDRMAAELRACLDAALADWKALHARIAVAVQRTEESEPQVKQLEDLLNSTKSRWEDFVERIMEIQVKFTAEKNGLFTQLAASEDSARQQRDEVKQLNQDVQARVAQAEQKIDGALNELPKEEEKTANDLEGLNIRLVEFKGKCAATEVRLDQIALQTDSHLREASEKMTHLNGESTNLKTELDALDVQIGEIKRRKAENERLRAEITSRTTELDRENHRLLDEIERRQKEEAAQAEAERKNKQLKEERAKQARQRGPARPGKPMDMPLDSDANTGWQSGPPTIVAPPPVAQPPRRRGFFARMLRIGTFWRK